MIRRLFAVSLKLSGALAMIEHKEAGRRVDEAIADLDQTVKLIRSVVFALEHGSLPQWPRPRRRPTERARTCAEPERVGRRGGHRTGAAARVSCGAQVPIAASAGS